MFLSLNVAVAANSDCGAGNTSTQGVFCNSAPLTLSGGKAGPGSPYPFQVAASGLTGTVSAVRVTLNGFTSTTPLDVVLMLLAPDEKTGLVFFGGVCGYAAISKPLDITLTDSADVPAPTELVSGATACRSGSYKPYVHLPYTSDSCPEFPPNPASHLPSSAPCAAPNATPQVTFRSVFNGVNPNGRWSIYAISQSASDKGKLSGGAALTIETGAVKQ